MPIYDMNQAGQVVSELRSLYDMNPAGEIVSKIGKVYDNDGTTDHLIYSAEQYLFNYGLVSGVSWAGNRNGSVQSNNLQVWETAYDFASYVYTTSKISLTGWSYLCGYAKFFNSTYTGGRVGLGVNSHISMLNWAAVQFINSTSSTAETYQTFRVDISALTGSYYVLPFAHSSSSGANFYKIWLE